MGIKMTHSGSLGMQHSITVSDEYLEHRMNISNATKKSQINGLSSQLRTKVETTCNKAAIELYNKYSSELRNKINSVVKQYKENCFAIIQEATVSDDYGMLEDLQKTLNGNITPENIIVEISVNSAISRQITIPTKQYKNKR